MIIVHFELAQPEWNRLEFAQLVKLRRINYCSKNVRVAQPTR